MNQFERWSKNNNNSVGSGVIVIQLGQVNVMISFIQKIFRFFHRIGLLLGNFLHKFLFYMNYLGQPYIIGSLRLLLWDCDSRTYSFYIETSVNQKDWEIAVDKREEQLRSWQQFTFTPRAVVFFKIVGTYNTANEVRVNRTFVVIVWTCCLSTNYFVTILFL